MNGHEHDRRQGPGRRSSDDELSPQRLESLIIDLRDELQEMRADLSEHKLATARFIERMPSAYVTRKEHEQQSASTLLKLSVIAAMASPLVTVLVNLAFHHH